MSEEILMDEEFQSEEDFITEEGGWKNILSRVIVNTL